MKMKRNKIRVFSLLFVVFIALAATPQITSLPTGVGTLGNPAVVVILVAQAPQRLMFLECLIHSLQERVMN